MYPTKGKVAVKGTIAPLIELGAGFDIELTARENIAVPSLLNNIKPNEEILRDITDALGITERLDHFPGELSGGEQQRVAIARALINDPACILADEPTGNLDGTTTRDVMDMLSKLNRDGRTIVIVTHDPEVAKYCNRVINIVDGKCIK